VAFPAKQLLVFPGDPSERIQWNYRFKGKPRGLWQLQRFWGKVGGCVVYDAGRRIRNGVQGQGREALEVQGLLSLQQHEDFTSTNNSDLAEKVGLYPCFHRTWRISWNSLRSFTMLLMQSLQCALGQYVALGV